MSDGVNPSSAAEGAHVAAGSGGAAGGSPPKRRTSITMPRQWLNSGSSSNVSGAGAPKVVFITGASSGLGLALVKAFATAGWKVIASCRRPEISHALGRFLKEAGLPPAVPMTVSDAATIEAAFSITRELTTHVDVFINNAGVLNFNHSPYDPVMEISMEEMIQVYQVNVAGCLKVTQTFLPLVQASWRRPVIINISSPLGSIEQNQGGFLAPYRCSKAALNMLTKTFAAEMPSVIFLAVAPRQWNKVPPDDAGLDGEIQPGGGCFGARQEGEIKQDLRYHPREVDPNTDGPDDDDESAKAAAKEILNLATSVNKEDSGSFLYADGEKVQF